MVDCQMTKEARHCTGVLRADAVGMEHAHVGRGVMLLGGPACRLFNK